MRKPGARAKALALGEQHYFTGAPCKRGHISLRRASNGVCEDCNRANNQTRDPEEFQAYMRAWRAAHPGRSTANARSWELNNPERAAEQRRLGHSLRRARKCGAEGSHTAADLAVILKAQGFRCALCRVSLRKTQKHADHIVPLARGGSNWARNIQYLCAACNISKSARDPVEHAQSMGLLL